MEQHEEDGQGGEEQHMEDGQGGKEEHKEDGEGKEEQDGNGGQGGKEEHKEDGEGGEEQDGKEGRGQDAQRAEEGQMGEHGSHGKLEGPLELNGQELEGHLEGSLPGPGVICVYVGFLIAVCTTRSFWHFSMTEAKCAACQLIALTI